MVNYVKIIMDDHILYEGNTLPDEITLDIGKLPTGLYLLKAIVETDCGSDFTTSLVFIQNADAEELLNYGPAELAKMKPESGTVVKNGKNHIEISSLK